MKQVSFILLTMCFLAFAKPVSAQFFERGTGNPVFDGNNTVDMYRTPRVGIGFTTNTAFNAALGTANRARLAVRDGIIAHHVSDTIGNFAGKWLGLGIGNPGGPVQPYGLAIADTGSVAFYNVLRENFNGVIRKNTVAGFGAESMRNTECGIRNAEYGMRNTECGIRNAECGIRNAEYGIRNAECGICTFPLLFC